MCNDMWLVAQKRTLRELLACLSNSPKAMAERSPDMTKERAVFVHALAHLYRLCATMLSFSMYVLYLMRCTLLD